MPPFHSSEYNEGGVSWLEVTAHVTLIPNHNNKQHPKTGGQSLDTYVRNCMYQLFMKADNNAKWDHLTRDLNVVYGVMKI